MKLSARANAVIIAGTLVVVLALTWQVFTLDYQTDTEGIHISWFLGVTIPLNSIEDVVVMEERPSLSRRAGFNLLQFRQGNYTLEEVGAVKLYVNDINRPLVLIYTDSVIYGITPEDTGAFVEAIAAYRGE